MMRTDFIAFDAKRAFLNRRGLGNYSRDVIRLMTSYAPEAYYGLLTPKRGSFYTPPTEHTQVIEPSGGWRLCPSLWRSKGCVTTLRKIQNHSDYRWTYWGLSGELPYRIDTLGMRMIVTMHDAIFVRYPELYSPTYRTLFARKVQYACDIADTIVAISEQTKRDIIEFFHADEKKIKVVYQGCSHLFREPVREETIAEAKSKYHLPEQYILDVGAIEPRKNLQNLIRAMAAEHIDVPLVAIGGHSGYADDSQRLARELGVPLILRHEVSFTDFPALYKGAQVLCYPSIFEGFGIPILEAMCVGTPVLTSTGSCFAETGGPAARYANPMDIEDIGQQLSKVLSDSTLRAEMEKKGYQQAALFTDEVVATNLRAVLFQE